MNSYHLNENSCGFLSAVNYSSKVVIFYLRERSIYYGFLTEQLKTKYFTGRIRAYIQKIGLFVIPFFEALCGKKLGRQQIENLLLAGILTPLFDDALESNHVDKYLKIVHKLPVDFSDSKTEFFSETYQILSEGLANHENFYRQMQIIVDIETFESSPYEKLGKGSAALLLYAVCTNLNFSASEKDFISQTGAYFQLIDDIYDKNKDRAKNIATLPILWEHQTDKLKRLLTFQKQRLIHHPVLKGLPTKNKKTIEGIIVLLYCLAVIRIKYRFYH